MLTPDRAEHWTYVHADVRGQELERVVRRSKPGRSQCSSGVGQEATTWI